MFRNTVKTTVKTSYEQMRRSLSSLGLHDPGDFRKAMKNLNEQIAKTSTITGLVNFFSTCSKTVSAYLLKKENAITLHLSEPKKKERMAIKNACKEFESQVKKLSLSTSTDSQKLVKCVEYANAALKAIRLAEEQAGTGQKKESLAKDLQAFVDAITKNSYYTRAVTNVKNGIELKHSPKVESGVDTKESKTNKTSAAPTSVTTSSAAEQSEPSLSRKGKTGLLDVWRIVKDGYANYQEDKRTGKSALPLENKLQEYADPLILAEQEGRILDGFKIIDQYLHDIDKIINEAKDRNSKPIVALRDIAGQIAAHYYYAEFRPATNASTTSTASSAIAAGATTSSAAGQTQQPVQQQQVQQQEQPVEQQQNAQQMRP